MSTLLANIENTKRFADLRHAVDREFSMVPGEPSIKPDDEGAPVDGKCLVNCWGSTPEQYIEQFQAALDRISYKEAERLKGQSRKAILSGCEFTEHELIERTVRSVRGISCIPDSQLPAHGERQQDLIGEQFDNTPTPVQAPVRWNEQRYSL